MLIASLHDDALNSLFSYVAAVSQLLGEIDFNLFRDGCGSINAAFDARVSLEEAFINLDKVKALAAKSLGVQLPQSRKTQAPPDNIRSLLHSVEMIRRVETVILKSVGADPVPFTDIDLDGLNTWDYFPKKAGYSQLSSAGKKLDNAIADIRSAVEILQGSNKKSRSVA